MSVQPYILVVEDEEALATLLHYNLEKENFRVDLCADGEEAMIRIDEKLPDLVILDWMLPSVSGIEVCRRLRQRSVTRNLPIIMLTARGEETDRIVGLEMGADDYLAKPFSPRELLARIKSVLRRTRSLPRNLRADDARGIAFASWRLDTVARHLVSPEGVVTSLSGNEYQLLRIFLSHPNHVLTRDQLMLLSKGHDADPLDRSIDIQVSRLRHRLGDDPADPQIIKTVRGEGYVLAVPVEVER